MGKVVLKFKGGGPVESAEVAVDDLGAVLRQLGHAVGVVERVSAVDAAKVEVSTPRPAVPAATRDDDLGENGRKLLLLLYEHYPHAVRSSVAAEKLGIETKGLGPVILSVFNFCERRLKMARGDTLIKGRLREHGEPVRTLRLADPLMQRMKEGLAEKLRTRP